jgi:hypothetical protein
MGKSARWTNALFLDSNYSEKSPSAELGTFKIASL